MATIHNLAYGRWLLSSAIVFPSVIAPLRAETRDPLAVLPLRTATIEQSKIAVLDSLLVNVVDEANRYHVISTADVSAMLGYEKAKEAAGCDDLACAAEIAGALAVRFILTGTADHLGDTLVLTLTLSDAQAMQVVRRARHQARADENAYPQALEEVVAQVFEQPRPAPTAIPAPRASPAMNRVPESVVETSGRWFATPLLLRTAGGDSTDGSWTAAGGAELVSDHGEYFSHHARLAGALLGDWGWVRQNVGLLVGAGEEAHWTLARDSQGRRVLAFNGEVSVEGVLTSPLELYAVGSAGVHIYRAYLQATIGYKPIGNLDAPGMIGGVNAGLIFPL